MGLSGAKLYCLSGRELVPACETLYQAEADLQRLISDNPRLLLRDPDNSAQALYLISEELSLQDTSCGSLSYALDHLFIDQDGIPVLVEVKRSTDTRIRREVAGQMLDYASRIRTWNAAQLRSRAPASQRIPEALWPALENNLKTERMKLVFAADSIPDSLAVLIDFMDRSMHGIEVYGVEIKQYTTEDGSVLISSSVVGGSSSLEKQIVRSSVLWDAASMAAQLEHYGNAASIPIVSALAAFASEAGLQIEYGRDTKFGLLRAVWNGRRIFSITSWEKADTGLRTNVELSLSSLAKQTANHFDEEALRSMLLSFPDASAADSTQYIFGSPTYPYIDIRLLADSSNMAHFQHSIRQILSVIPER